MEGIRKLFIDRGKKERTESVELQTTIPIVAATMKECERLSDKSERLEKLRDFLTEYFHEAIENTQVYSSERLGASFPFTVIRLSEIAHALAGGNGYSEISSESISRQSKKREFMFGTFFDVRAGHPYHWIEHAIDEVAKKLPGALEDIRAGKEPEDLEIYGIGSPAGELGTVSDQFTESVGTQPFEKFGELYGEFIRSRYENDPERESSRQTIHLWGVSMGSSLAATTAENLISTEFATQSHDDARTESKPFVRVDMLMPVAAHESSVRRWQIPAGFVAEFAIQSLAGPEYNIQVARAERDFTESIYRSLRARGIETHLTDEDLSRKKKIVSASIEEMRSGIPLPPGLKTNEIIGMNDPLMYSMRRKKEALLQRETHDGSLGAYTIDSHTDNRRQFAIDMTHTPAVVREQYFKRLLRVGETLADLGKRE